MERLHAAGRVAVAAILGVALSSCGGGGGGGGGAVDPSTAPGLAVTPATVGFSAVHNGILPPAQSLQIAISRTDWASLAVGYPPSVTPASWLPTNPSVSGAGLNWTLSGGVTTTSMAPGSYTTTLRIALLDAIRSPIAYRDVPVSYTITSAPVTASPSQLSFTQVIGSPAPATQTVALMGDIGAWTASADQAWIGVTQASGTGTGSVGISVNAAGLGPGTYTGAVSFASSSATAKVNVSFTIVLPDIQPSLSTLSFSGINGAAIPSQSINIVMNNGAPLIWNASSGAPWLILDKASGSQSDALGVSVNPAIGPLASGTYTSTITVNTSVGGVPVNKTVGVTLTLTAPVFQTSLGSLSFSGVNGAAFASQSLGIALNSGAAVTWNASSGAPWLILDKTSGSPPDALGISVNPANGPLASGTYTSAITLTGSFRGDTLSKTINVTLTLTKATLAATPPSVTLGGSNGRDLSGVPVQLSLNTGANAYAWSSSAPSFVQRSLSSGSVSATPLAITLTPDRTGLLGNTYNGSLNFSLQINGDTVSTNVPITLNLDAHKLLVDDNGVAFASTPALSKLTRTLRVHDNFGLATNWSASSNQPWLTVTPSGTTDGDLVLTANPSSLTADTVNLAAVTITSDDATVENSGSEKVRVGLWVGSTTPSPTTPISATYFEIAADPIRPYAYAAGTGGNIQIYNVYTGLPVTTINSVAAQVGAMTVSHDGSTLYAVDTINFKIVPVSLDSLSVGAPWVPSSPVYYVTYTRANGTGVVLSGNGQIFNAETGAAFAAGFSGGYYYYSAVAAAQNGTRFCGVNTLSPYTISCYALDYTSLDGGKVIAGAAKSGPFGIGSNGRDIALSANGTRAYVAAGAPYQFDVYDTETMGVVQTLPGDSYPNCIEVAVDGRIFAGASVWYDPVDVWVYDAGGTQLGAYRMAGYARALQDRQLKVSGDGIRMITLTDDPLLTFTTVGP
jgi:BACON domain-containing protein